MNSQHDINKPLAGRWCAFIAALILSFGGGPAAVAADTALVMGVIHADSADTTYRLTPMADYIADRLSSAGVDRVLIVVAPDRAALIELLRYERVDWISETAFNALAIEETGLVDMVARTWRGGTPSYRSLFVVRRDSEYTNLRELDGAAIAFERESSTSGFFIPTVALLQADRTLCRLSRPRQRPANHCVGFAFAQRPYNTAMWVHKGIVEAGVLSSDDWASAEIVPPALRDDFRILYESQEVPRGIELLRTGLAPAIRQRLLQVLMTMHTDRAADQALASYFGTRRIDRLDDIDRERLGALRAALPQFNAQIQTLRP